ncbi:MAG: hypothetical protein JJ992_07875, partial [Planctomycetes bacterium]|nr:hypothetical protein [Planctomycetota bacterium]
MAVDAESTEASEGIEPSIERAVKYLQSQQREDGSWHRNGNPNHDQGVTALAALALLHSGRIANDKSISQAAEYLRDKEPSFTYTVALQTLVFCALDPQKHRELIDRNVKWLVETQTTAEPARGGWSYGPQRSTRSDGSNTRFAAWAFDAARRAGFEIPETAWRSLADYWLSSQHEDGSWGYQVTLPQGTPTMTLAGVASLAAVESAVSDTQLHSRIDKAIELAWKWHDASFSAADHLEQGRNFPFYALHCLSLAGRMNEHAGQGASAWYPAGTRRLLELQSGETGAWTGDAAENPVIATSFALLFLDAGANPLEKNGRGPGPDASTEVPPEPVRANHNGTRPAGRTEPETGVVVLSGTNEAAPATEVLVCRRDGHVLERLRTDESGRFTARSRWWDDQHGSENEILLVARDEHHRIGWYDFQQQLAWHRRQARNADRDVSVAETALVRPPIRIVLLDCDQTLTGRLVDPEDRPIADVRVVVRSLINEANRYAGLFGYGIDDPLPFPSAKTDQTGRFQLRVPAGAVKNLQTLAALWVTRNIPVGNDNELGAIRLAVGGRIAGVVTDAGTGKPVPGTPVVARGLTSEGESGGFGYAVT